MSSNFDGRILPASANFSAPPVRSEDTSPNSVGSAANTNPSTLYSTKEEITSTHEERRERRFRRRRDERRERDVTDQFKAITDAASGIGTATPTSNDISSEKDNKYRDAQPQLLQEAQPQPPKSRLSNHQLIPANSKIQKLTDVAKDSSPEDRRTAIQKQIDADLQKEVAKEVADDIVEVNKGGPKERTKGKWMMVAAIVALIAGIALLIVASFFTAGTAAVFAAMVGSTYAPVMIAGVSGALMGLGLGGAARAADHLRQRDTQQNLENLQKLNEELEMPNSPYRGYIDKIYTKYAETANLSAETANLSNETKEEQARRKKMLLRDMESFHKWHEWKNVQKESKAIQDVNEREAVLNDFQKQEEKFYVKLLHRPLPETKADQVDDDIQVALQPDETLADSKELGEALDTWILGYRHLRPEIRSSDLEDLKKKKLFGDKHLEIEEPVSLTTVREELQGVLADDKDFKPLWKRERDLKLKYNNQNKEHVQEALALYQDRRKFLDKFFATQLNSFPTEATEKRREERVKAYENQLNELSTKFEDEGVVLYDPTKEEGGQPT